MMYMINDYRLIEGDGDLYLSNYSKGVRVSNPQLQQVLKCLQKQDKLEVSEQQLKDIACRFAIDFCQLKEVLMDKLSILKPLTPRKFSRLYINADDDFIAEALSDAFKKEYQIERVAPEFSAYQAKSLVIFFRSNYSHQDFKKLFETLAEDVYLLTAGIVHNVLIIDNLYYRNSGLPTHFSNLSNLLASVYSSLSVTKNNWLLFYRSLLKERSEQFPDPEISLPQKGYVAHCLSRFASQFTHFWNFPTTLDAINWFWHVDLNGLTVFKEVAVHSPYSKYDMNLNVADSALIEETLC